MQWDLFYQYFGKTDPQLLASNGKKFWVIELEHRFLLFSSEYNSGGGL